MFVVVVVVVFADDDDVTVAIHLQSTVETWGTGLGLISSSFIRVRDNRITILVNIISTCLAFVLK